MFTIYIDIFLKIIRALDHVGILTALFGTLVSFITEIFHCQAVSYIRSPQKTTKIFFFKKKQYYQGWRTVHVGLATTIFIALVLQNYEKLSRCAP